MQTTSCDCGRQRIDLSIHTATFLGWGIAEMGDPDRVKEPARYAQLQADQSAQKQAEGDWAYEGTLKSEMKIARFNALQPGSGGDKRVFRDLRPANLPTHPGQRAVIRTDR